MNTFIFVVIWMLLQVMQWIIHWVFCNWDLPSLADGALVLSHLQVCATYGKLVPTSLFSMCSFWDGWLPSSVKLKGPDSVLLWQMNSWFPAKGFESPTCSLAGHIHHHYSKTQETDVALLISQKATETNCNWHWVGLFGSTAPTLTLPMLKHGFCGITEAWGISGCYCFVIPSNWETGGGSG